MHRLLKVTPGSVSADAKARRASVRRIRNCPPRRGAGRRAPSYAGPVSDAPYRVQPPRPPDPYLVAWAKLRRRRALAWGGFLLWAFAFTAFVVALAAQARAVGVTAVVAVMCWGSGIAGALILGHFRCPHCSAIFYGLRRPRAPWSDACIACGIAIGTPKNPRPSDAR
jgi:hypothetical protein